MGKIYKASDFMDTPAEQPKAAKRIYSASDFADDGEALPEYANGLAPDAAINESPVSLEDRAKLSVGNTKGKLEFLNTHYGEARQTESGDFVVKTKKDGLWRRVDPEGLGDGDPWSITREVLGDAIDLVPMATNIASQIGIGVATAPLIPVTGGASVAATAGIAGAAGAALSGVETSLGRLVGTYSGSIEDQAKDAAIETLMSLGGTAVAAGIKPTAKYIANGLSKSAKVIAENPATRDVVSFISGMNVKGGAKSVERLFDAPDDVANFMTKAAAGAKGADDAINLLKVDNVMDSKEIALKIRPALTEFFERGKAEVLSSVDSGFKVNFADDLAPMFKTLAEKGVASVDDAGKYTLKPFDKYVTDMQLAGKAGEMLNDKASYDVVSEMFEEVQKYAKFGSQQGKAAAANFLDMRRNIFDLSFKLRTTADDAGLAPAQRILSEIKDIGDDAIYAKFKLKEPASSAMLGNTDNLYKKLNEEYHGLIKQFTPILNSVRSAQRGGDVVYENLYNKLASDGGKNAVLKSGFDNAVDFLSAYSKSGYDVLKRYENIKSRDAAMAFMPNLRPGLMTNLSIPAAVSSAAVGNVGVAAPIAIGAVVTSPKVNYKVVRGMLKAAGLVKSLPPAQRGMLLKSADAMKALYQPIIERPVMERQLTSELLQQAGTAVTGKPQGQ